MGTGTAVTDDMSELELEDGCAGCDDFTRGKVPSGTPPPEWGRSAQDQGGC